MFPLLRPFRRNIHIPISWFECFDDPPMSVEDSAVTPDHSLLIAGFAFLPTVIEGDPSPERAHGTIVKVSLSRSSSVKVYQPGMDNLLIGIDVNTNGEAFACGLVTLPFLVAGFGWILKLDANGTPLWERRVGENAADRAMFFERVVATNDGGAAASGFLDEGQTRDRFFAKFDADGNLQFTHAIRGLVNAEDCLIAAMPGGELVICFDRRPILGPGVVACRFDSSGTLQWQREMPDLFGARSLSPLPDGSVLIGAAVRQIGNTPAGPVVVKLDSAGLIPEVKRVNAQNEAGNPLGLRILHVAVTADEGILVLAATTVQSMLVGRFDGAGQALWGRTIDIDENFVAAGFSPGFAGAEVELAQASTYLLTLGNASNPERDIRVPIARLDEHGDIGLNGCGLLAPVALQLTSDTLQIQDILLTLEALTPPVTTVSSTVTEPDVSTRTVCLQERHIKFDPPFLDPPLTICFDDLPLPGIDPVPVPPGPEPGPGPRPAGRSRFGSLLPPMTCNSDPGCLRCLVRPDDGRHLPNPEWRAQFYRALRPFTMLPEGRVPVEAAEVLRSALAKLPGGELLTSDALSELGERIARWKKTRAKGNSYIPRDVALYRHLAQAANLLDLDLLVARPQLEQVADGLAVNGLVRLRQDPRVLSGASVQLAGDAPGPLLPGLMAGWPALLWQVKLRDEALEYGIELSYRGCRFSAPETALRVVQWRGQKCRDITRAVDQRTCVVLGRASGSGTFAILEQDRGRR